MVLFIKRNLPGLAVPLANLRIYLTISDLIFVRPIGMELFGSCRSPCLIEEVMVGISLSTAPPGLKRKPKRPLKRDHSKNKPQKRCSC